MSEAYISLKWGTINGWKNISEDIVTLLEEYWKDGRPFGSMSDRPNEERRLILCKIIDAFDGELQNDWTGKNMTKEEAKKYIMEYDK